MYFIYFNHICYFVYSSGAILPAYFDLVSRLLYKHRAIFFAANLTTGSLAGFLVSRYVDNQIQENGLINGFLDGLLVVIVITSLSLIPLILIKEPKSNRSSKSKITFKLIKQRIIIWYEIISNSNDIKVVAKSNIVSAIPESITPFFYYLVDSFLCNRFKQDWYLGYVIANKPKPGKFYCSHCCI